MKTISSILAAAAMVVLSTVPALAADATVDVQDNSFSPATVTVDSGDTVTWEVSGLNPHNVIADEGEFSSATLSQGDDFSHTFASPGTFDYMCSIHGSIMSGRVVVRGASSTFAPPSDGSAGGDVGAGGLAETGARHPRRDAAMLASLMLIGLGVTARVVAGRVVAGRVEV